MCTGKTCLGFLHHLNQSVFGGLQVSKTHGSGEHRPRCRAAYPAGRYILSGFLPLVQKLPELIRPAAKGLVVPALGAADDVYHPLTQRHQTLVSRTDPLAAHSLGLSLRQIAGSHDLILDQIIDLGVLGRMGGEAQLFHALGEIGSHLPVAVDDEHVLGLGGLDVSDPRQQVIPVGMGGKALEVHDLGVNGDLLAKESWKKSPQSVFSKNGEVNGVGGPSIFTSPDGKTRYILYHGYLGKDTSGGRYCFMEPYSVDADGVHIGKDGHPSPLSTVFTVPLNTMPLGAKVSGFDNFGTTRVKLKIGRSVGSVNEIETQLDAAPVIRNNRTMLPARFVA